MFCRPEVSPASSGAPVLFIYKQQTSDSHICSLERYPRRSGEIQRWALIFMNCTCTSEYRPTGKFGDTDDFSHLAEGPDEGCDKKIDRRSLHNLPCYTSCLCASRTKFDEFTSKSKGHRHSNSVGPCPLSVRQERLAREGDRQRHRTISQTPVRMNHLEQLHPMEFSNRCPNQVSVKSHRSSL